MEDKDLIIFELKYKYKKLELINKKLEEEISILNKLKDIPLKKIIYKEIIKRRKNETRKFR